MGRDKLCLSCYWVLIQEMVCFASTSDQHAVLVFGLEKGESAIPLHRQVVTLINGMVVHLGPNRAFLFGG